MATISLRDNWPLLVLFFLVVAGIGFVVGLIAAPGPWFDTLAKPPYIPPSVVSGPVWFVLTIAFAIAGWRLWQIDSTSVETRLWLASLIVSWWFLPTFFIARAPAAALAVIIVLLALMLIFILRAWRADRVSALLFVPCAAWVAYGTVLTAQIVAMNPTNAG